MSSKHPVDGAPIVRSVYLWFRRLVLLLATWGACAPVAATPERSGMSKTSSMLPVQLPSKASGNLAPMVGIRPERDGRVAVAIPRPGSVQVLWRGQIPGGIAYPPAVDDRGHLIVATSANRIEELDRRGRSLWEYSLPAAIAAAPVVLSAGTRVVLTQDGQLNGLDRAGAVEFRTLLPGPHGSEPGKLLALSDGGAVALRDHTLCRIYADGSLRAQVVLAEPPRQIYGDDHDRLLLLTERGQVLGWSGTAEFSDRGRLPFSDAPAPLVEAGGFVGVVGQDVSFLSVLEPSSSKWAELNDTVLTPLAATHHGVVAGHARGIVFISRDGTIDEIPLWNVPPNSAPLSIGPLVAPDESIALVSPLGRLVLVAPDHSAETLDQVRCAQARGLVPLGPSELALACASGTIWGVGSGQREPAVRAPVGRGESPGPRP
jgi:hypothetical protein